MAQKDKFQKQNGNSCAANGFSFRITTDIGYSVLVKGEKSSDVATRVGRSKQNISNAVKRIRLYQNTTLKVERRTIKISSGSGYQRSLASCLKKKPRSTQH